MSAEVVSALHQQAHALDAEADNAGAAGQPVTSGTDPGFLRRMAQEFRDLAHRIEGKDPAAVNAEAQARQEQGSDGLSVQKTDSETGQQVTADPPGDQPGSSSDTLGPGQS